MTFSLPRFDLDEFVRATLGEDLGTEGDITSAAVIPPDVRFGGVMASRDAIGQAKGVLMERHRITGDEAFEMLKQASRRANRKLVDVAEILAATGELPQPSD